MFLRNRFLGLGDASVVATFPPAIQKFIADGQAENPAFMDAYLKEVLALPNPYDRILADLADAFVGLEASDFQLSGLGSIGGFFKSIAKAVIGLHQKLFAGLKKGVRVVERVWHKYGNIILQVIGTILAPFTFGISLAVTAVLVMANNMYQKKQELLKAKDARRDDENAIAREVAAAELETTAQVDKFYFDNQKWFIDNLAVGTDKWNQLTLDQKIGLLKTGDTSKLPPDAVPIMSELIPITRLYQYGPVVLEIDTDTPTGPIPALKLQWSSDYPIAGAPMTGLYSGYPTYNDILGRYRWWASPVPTFRGSSVPPRNQVYYGPALGPQKLSPAAGTWFESERSLTDIVNQQWPRFEKWFLDNFNLTKAKFDQLSIDDKIGLMSGWGASVPLSGNINVIFPPKGAVLIGERQGPAVSQMEIPPPPVTTQGPTTNTISLPPAPPGSPASAVTQTAVNQAAQVAAQQVSSGVPYAQTLQNAVSAVTSVIQSAGGTAQPVKPPVATASLFGDIGVGPVAMIGGLILSFMQEKKKARRNPGRRWRRAR